MGLAALGLSYSTLQAVSTVLQVMVTAGMVSDIPHPTPVSPGGIIIHLSLFHLKFTCGVMGDIDLPPFWEAIAQGQGKTEGLATLN